MDDNSLDPCEGHRSGACSDKHVKFSTTVIYYPPFKPGQIQLEEFLEQTCDVEIEEQSIKPCIKYGAITERTDLRLETQFSTIGYIIFLLIFVLLFTIIAYVVKKLLLIEIERQMQKVSALSKITKSLKR